MRQYQIPRLTVAEISEASVNLPARPGTANHAHTVRAHTCSQRSLDVALVNQQAFFSFSQ